MKKLLIPIILLIIVPVVSLSTPFYPETSDHKTISDPDVIYGFWLARRSFSFTYLPEIPKINSDLTFSYGERTVEPTPIEIFLLIKTYIQYGLIMSIPSILFIPPAIVFIGVVWILLTLASAIAFFIYVLYLYQNRKNLTPKEKKIVRGIYIYAKNHQIGQARWAIEFYNTVFAPAINSFSGIFWNPTETVDNISDHFILKPFTALYQINYLLVTKGEEFITEIEKDVDSRYFLYSDLSEIARKDAIRDLDSIQVVFIFLELSPILKIPSAPRITLKFNSSMKGVIGSFVRQLISVINPKMLSNYIFTSLNLIRLKESGYLDSFSFSISSLNNSTSVVKSSTVLARDFTKSRKFSKSDDLANILDIED